jgi:hypothetical protein
MVIGHANAIDSPIALIVTMSNYVLPNLALSSTKADGDAFAKRLIAAGFQKDRVLVYSDLDVGRFRALIADAASRYKSASSFVFYYSGHGILYNNHARLIPTDFSVVDLQSTIRPRSLTDQTVAVADITNIFGSSASVPALFIFDACQDDGGILSQVLAGVLTDAASHPTAPPVPVGQIGTFDNQGDVPMYRIGEPETLGHDNSLVMLAAIRSKWGAGVSYALPDKTNSEFTDSLLSLMAKWPDRGVNEIFPIVKSTVLTDTANLHPPQLPFQIDHMYGSTKLNYFANPPPTEVAPAPLFGLTATQTTVGTAVGYVGSVARSAAHAAALHENYVYSAPFKLSGVSLPALARQLEGAAAASSKIVANLQAREPAPAANAPELEVTIVARLWDLVYDRRVYGVGGTRPPIHVPSSSTLTRRLDDGTVEYKHNIVADQGFRILTTTAAPSIAVNLLDFSTRYMTDSGGITAETKIWHLPVGPNGRPNGSFEANLSVVEQRPEGSIRLPLTGQVKLYSDQSVVLALTSEDVERLDVIQLLAPTGAPLVSLQVGDRLVVPGTSMIAGLNLLENHPVLQIESIQ